MPFVLWSLFAIHEATSLSMDYTEEQKTEFKFHCNLTNITVSEEGCLNRESGPCDLKSCVSCTNGTHEFVTADGDDNCVARRHIFDAEFAVYDIIGLLIWFFGSGLCSAAGVGGGSIWVPLGILLLRYDVVTATGISQCSIFGGSLAAFILNMRTRHPTANRPLINFELVSFMGPLMLFGALCGVLIQQTLPRWSLMLLMAVVLSAVSVKLAKTARARRAKDLEAMKQKKLPELGTTDAMSSFDEGPRRRTSVPRSIEDGSDMTSYDDIVKGQVKVRGQLHDRDTWLMKDAAFPAKSLGYLGIIWFGRQFFFFLQGSPEVPSFAGIARCSPVYWLVWTLSLLWLLGCACKMGVRLVSKSVRRTAVNTPHVEGDVYWDYTRLLKMSALGTTAGIVSALIGIGGGPFIGPLMLHLGVLPVVSSASSATMVLFTSSSLAIIYVVTMRVTWSVALTFFCAAFFGSMLGKKLIDAWVKKRNMTWVLIAILTCIIIAGIITTITSGLLLYAKQDWQFETTFNPICE